MGARFCGFKCTAITTRFLVFGERSQPFNFIVFSIVYYERKQVLFNGSHFGHPTLFIQFLSLQKKLVRKQEFNIALVIRLRIQWMRVMIKIIR